jgi:hypothetical protein
MIGSSSLIGDSWFSLPPLGLPHFILLQTVSIEIELMDNLAFSSFH